MSKTIIMRSHVSLSALTLAFSLAAPAYAQEEPKDEDIVVIAQRNNETQVIRGGSLGALGDMDAMSTPFAIKSYSDALILNQQPQSLGQVLDNDPAVRTTYGFGNASEQFVIRGFPLNGEDIAIDGLFGLAPRQLVSPELYDQVQILNGASSFLFGAAPSSSALGGTVNLQPKRARDEAINRVTLNYVSDAHFGGAFDFGRRFGEEKQFGARINAAARRGDISIDDEFRSSLVVGVGLDWRSDRARVSLDLAYQRTKVQHMRPMVQLAFGVADVPAPPSADGNFGQEWNFTTLRDVFGILKGEYDLTDEVMVYAAFGARDSAERGNYQSFNITNPVTGDAYVTGSQIPRNDNNEAGQVGVRAKFATGSITHQINVGASHLRQVNRNAFGFGSFAGSPNNLYDPVQVPEPDYSFFPGGDRDNPFPISRTRLTSFFASDTIGAFDDKVLLTLGLRRQKLDLRSYSYYASATEPAGFLATRYKQSATTPVVGLVVKPTETLSLYANRIEGLSQGDTAPAGSSNVGEVFPPYKSVQYELGAKVAVGTFNASIAIYQIKKPQGILPIDPDGGGPLQPTFGVDGFQRNRGLELSVDGEPAKGLRIIAGLSINDAKQAKTAGGLFDGNKAQGIPSYTANANVEWDLGFVPGVTLTGRVIQTGKQYFDQANLLPIPEWTRVDLGARYVLAVGDIPVTFRFNVDNVANDNYWASAFGSFGGQLTLAAPRTYKTSVTVDF